MNRSPDFQPAVYIMSSQTRGTLYTGVTSNLAQRAYQHRCKRLVWFELHATMEAAITREKQIEGGSRQKKIALIESANPEWRDLFYELNR